MSGEMCKANEMCKSKPMHLLGGLALLMLIIALGSYAQLNFAQIKYANPTPATISVLGEGEVLAIPDIGQFSFSVRADGTDAKTAQEQSGKKINEIIAYLKAQGIEEKDIKTQNYQLNEKWRWENEVCPAGSYCPGKQVQDGFEVVQTVSVKVRNLDTASGIIAGVGDNGATDISSLNFTIDDIEKVKAEARAKAIADAQAKAGVLAKQLGVRVQSLMFYNEESGYYQEPYYSKTMAFGVEEDADFAGADLPVGEESTKINVNITYMVQ